MIKLIMLHIPIRNLKQALNHGLVFKKVHKVTKFNLCLAKNIYWYEYLSKKKAKKWFWKKELS